VAVTPTAAVRRAAGSTAAAEWQARAANQVAVAVAADSEDAMAAAGTADAAAAAPRVYQETARLRAAATKVVRNLPQVGAS